MEKIEIMLEKNIDIDEFKKVVGFASEKIRKYVFDNQKLIIEFDDKKDEKIICESVLKLSQKYISNCSIERKVFSNKGNGLGFQKKIESIYCFDEGMIGLSDQSMYLFFYFEKNFHECLKQIFGDDECRIVKKVYPVLLPLKGYKKTRYLQRSPQYSMFCCSLREDMTVLDGVSEITNNNYKDILENPRYVLSPSACFHVYEEYKNRVLEGNTIVSFTQSVFRNEGRFNFSEFGRLRDYHVKEIVFIGDADFVVNAREKMMEATKKLVEQLKLDAKMVLASDPFILPKMQIYKKVQTIDKSKYELRMSYGEDCDMSVASFNLHGTAFSKPFNIRVQEKETVTGCVGYGLERFVLSFLSQYGENPEKWPKDIRDAYFTESKM